MIALYKLYYYITNQPYFMVYVTKHGRRVKKFIQVASSKAKGEDSFLMCKPLKACWWKPSKPVVDGMQFLTIVDIDNGIPLEISTKTEYNADGVIIKETVKETIKENVSKQKVNKKSGLPSELIEITFPPTMLFQIVEAHLVKEVLSSPPSKWDELKWVFIAGIVVAGFIIWQAMSSGGLSALGA